MRKTTILSFLVLLIAFLVWGIWYPRRVRPRLHAGYEIRENDVLLFSKDDFAYHDCKITIGYTYKAKYRLSRPEIL